jgi:hypothetical protein
MEQLLSTKHIPPPRKPKIKTVKKNIFSQENEIQLDLDPNTAKNIGNIYPKSRKSKTLPPIAPRGLKGSNISKTTNLIYRLENFINEMTKTRQIVECKL